MFFAMLAVSALECGAEDLEHSAKISDLLERITWYEMEYDELREFTHNEKEVNEEFFSDQVQISKLTPLLVQVLAST
jgi:hypothetical protein